MNRMDLLALAAVAGIAIRGWDRGTRAMVLWGLSLVAGSAAAAFLTPPLGGVLSDVAGISLLLAYPLTGAVVAALATAVARRALRMAEKARRAQMADGWTPRTPDQVGGALVGAGVGVAVVLFLGWVANSLAPLLGQRLDLADSRVVNASAQVAEPVVRVLAGRATGDVVMAASLAYLVSDPPAAKETAATLLSDKRLRTLAADPGVRTALANGDTLALSSSSLFAQLASDDAFLRAARRVRLLDAGAGPTSPAALAVAASQRLGPLVRAAQELGQDPTVQHLLEQSDVGTALAEGNLGDLLENPDVARVMDKIATKLRESR